MSYGRSGCLFLSTCNISTSCKVFTVVLLFLCLFYFGAVGNMFKEITRVKDSSSCGLYLSTCNISTSCKVFTVVLLFLCLFYFGTVGELVQICIFVKSTTGISDSS